MQTLFLLACLLLGLPVTRCDCKPCWRGLCTEGGREALPGSPWSAPVRAGPVQLGRWEHERPSCEHPEPCGPQLSSRMGFPFCHVPECSGKTQKDPEMVAGVFFLRLQVPLSLPAASTASGSLNSGLWVQVGIVAAHVLAVVVGRDRRQRAQAAAGLRHIPCGVTAVHACRPVPSKHRCDFCLTFWLMRSVTRCSLLSGTSEGRVREAHVTLLRCLSDASPGGFYVGKLLCVYACASVPWSVLGSWACPALLKGTAF